MDDNEFLAQRFEADRRHLRAVAYRMLGSLHEADDAVQEAWIRLSRSDTSEVDNLSGWLTTVVSRVCLDQLRTRRTRGEVSWDDQFHVPDPIIGRAEAVDPEHQALLADSVGLAMQVVLETLTPAERLAFVLHDMFALPYDEIALLVDKTPDAARQLASRARRRLQGTSPETDPGRQREVIEAFLAAARSGDIDQLVAVLDPDIVLRSDNGSPNSTIIRGARRVAGGAILFNRGAAPSRFAMINGTLGLVHMPDDRPVSVLGFTIQEGLITEINILSDPERLAILDFSALV